MNERCQGVGDQVCRGRLDADLGKHDCAAFFGSSFILLDHLGYKGDLSGDVEVMGAIFRTGLEGMLTVLAIGTHDGNENEGLLGQIGEVDIVQVAHFDARGSPVRVELLTLDHNLLQLGLRAASHGPLQISWQVGGDVLDGVLSGVT